MWSSGDPVGVQAGGQVPSGNTCYRSGDLVGIIGWRSGAVSGMQAVGQVRRDYGLEVR